MSSLDQHDSSVPLGRRVADVLARHPGRLVWVIVSVGAVAYGWGIATLQPEVYYAAAVRSMSMSWHNWIFAAADPAATMSIDKLPGAFWIQALLVRILGYHDWVMTLPQVVESLITIVLVFRAVRRMCGDGCALVAAALTALMPATVALARGNVSDALLVMLLVAAADAVLAATRIGRVRLLLLAGLLVGCAFQAKMLQAWLVLPVFALVWIIGAPKPIKARLVTAAGMIVIAVGVSLAWMLAVTAVPAHDRPAVDGSSHDSVFQQVFEYNGLNRGDTGASSIRAESPLTESQTGFTLDAQTRPGRLFADAGGRGIGWLLPLGVVAGGYVLWQRRRASRDDPLRLSTLLWGGWLLFDGVAFLAVSTINAYYLAALTPAIAGLIATAARHVLDTRAVTTTTRVWVFTALGGTVAYGVWLAARAPVWVQIACPLLSTCLLAVALRMTRRRSRNWRASAAALGIASVAVAPVVASVALIGAGGGPFNTPYQSPAEVAISQSGTAQGIANAALVAPQILANNPGTKYPAAAFPSVLGSPLIAATGIEILPIGGFTGMTPAPTLAALRRLVATRQLRTFLVAAGSTDPRTRWISSHCGFIASAGSFVIHVYVCPQASESGHGAPVPGQPQPVPSQSHTGSP